MSLQSVDPNIWAFWQDGDYYQSQTLLTIAQQKFPEQLEYIYYLGLAELLLGKIERAKEVWASNLTTTAQQAQLSDILDAEARVLEQQQRWKLALRIRQQLDDSEFETINNQLRRLFLLAQLGELAETDVLSVVSSLQERDTQGIKSAEINDNLSIVNQDLLLPSMQGLFSYAPDMPALLKLVKVMSPCICNVEAWLDLVKPQMAYMQERQLPMLACQYAQVCRDLAPEDIDIIRQSGWMFVFNGYTSEALSCAETLQELSDELVDHLFSNALILYAAHRTGENWQEVYSLQEKQLDLLEQLMGHPEGYKLPDLKVLTRSVFLQPYMSDCPAEHLALRQKVGQFLCESLTSALEKSAQSYRPTSQITASFTTQENGDVVGPRKLRIGYIGEFLRRHSVGWIARWLFLHHDHEQFEIYTYFNKTSKLQDFSVECFAQYSTKWRTLSGDIVDISQTIQSDNIDILVDVDSLTSASTYGVMALKPAPIQVTWLGWAASGLPTVDYFVADPHVLPDNAQTYYNEKIWRLPQSYLAVRGFEVDFPTQRREHLDIPVDAIVYLSNQNSIKRNDEFIRIQMRIIRQVPNSYFLVKILRDSEALQDYFYRMADLEGVSRDRLRFLPSAPTESLYRGNLSLADVVLDSYPYNGATTTLETLWVGLPLVTKVGQQFSSRNSYTMMKNAGIEEGIAWSDEEYINWGVRLGTDENLRKQVVLKLMRSRQTAPLWDAKKFTEELENAYHGMWKKHTDAYIQNKYLPEKISVSYHCVETEEKPSLPLLHNLARTGGTIISKCLGCMDQITLLSEIHPKGPELVANKLSLKASLNFSCLVQSLQWHQIQIDGLEYWTQKQISSTTEEQFIQHIQSIYAAANVKNSHLVLRDWCYIDFIGWPFQTPQQDDFLSELLQDHFQLQHAYLVRHPIDQWLSMLKLSILKGLSIEQYLNGYLSYLEYATSTQGQIEWLHYENFTSAPEPFLQKLTQKLHIPYDKTWVDKWPNYHNITGDSSAMKTVSKEIKARSYDISLRAKWQRDFEVFPAYSKILEITGYDPATID